MKIIDIKTYRFLKQRHSQEYGYRQKLMSMDKAALLQELLRYHEDFQKDPLDMNATFRGQHLLEILEQRAELNQLKDLAREFQDKLKARLYGQIQFRKR